MVFVSALLATLVIRRPQKQKKQQQQQQQEREREGGHYDDDDDDEDDDERRFVNAAFPPHRQYDGRDDDVYRTCKLRRACRRLLYNALLLQLSNAANAASTDENDDDDDDDDEELLLQSALRQSKEYVGLVRQLVGLLGRRSTRRNESALKKEHAIAVWMLAALQASTAQCSVAASLRKRNQQSDDQQQQQQQQQPSNNNNNLAAVNKKWKGACANLQLAACTVNYLRTQIMVGYSATSGRDDDDDDRKTAAATTTDDDYDDDDDLLITIPPLFLTKDFLEYWEDLLLADAQYSAYQCFALLARPKHYMLAKLAVAASKLYGEAGEVDISISVIPDRSSLSLSASASISSVINNADYYTDIGRSLNMYWTSRAEYHQAITCRKSKPPKHSHEAAWLESSLKYATLCQQYCSNSGSSSNSSSDKATTITTTTDVINELLERSTLEIQQALLNVQSDPCQNSELSEIRPQQTVKLTPGDIKKVLLDDKQCKKLAIVSATANNTVTTVTAASAARQQQQRTYRDSHGITGSRTTAINNEARGARPQPQPLPPIYDDDDGHITRRRHVQDFIDEMKQRYEQISNLVQEKTESARQTLSTVNLPHSLTTYKQQQQSSAAGGGASGGIPLDLWERVESIQEDQVVETIQRGLWELRDLADVAKSVYDQIDNLLREDVQMDALFREHHGPEFKGHDVEQVQRSFRQALENYNRLMTAANESDQLLIEKCQRMETDPKFRLLKFRKAQLDNLMIMPNNENDLDDGATAPDIDVSALSKYLVDLSALFDEREQLLARLETTVQSFDAGTAASKSSSSLSPQYIEKARRTTFDPIIDRIHKSIEQQKGLLVAILQENETFMNARAEFRSSHQDSCIVKIQDSLEEIEQFQKHLVEGRAFYDVILPKLTKLQHQVGDVSARLTIERCEYEDKQKRSRQEEEDARMAATLAEENNQGAGSGSRSADDDGDDNSIEDHPGAVPSSASLGDTTNTNENLGGSSNSFGMNEEREILGGRGSIPSSSAMHSREQQQQQQQQQYRPQHHHHQPHHSSSNHNRGFPGFEQVSHDVPVVRVDDEKVASLVAMDFDPEQVVSALRKYDNDVERALNDLLGG